MDAQRPALTAVVGGQGHFDAAVELAQPFVEIGGGGLGGGVGVVAGVEAGAVRPQAEALAGGAPELHRPRGAGTRGGVVLPVARKVLLRESRVWAGVDLGGWRV